MKDETPPSDLRVRTRKFAARIMRLGDSLPRTRSANVIAYQLIKSGSSVGAHYREGSRCRSDAELVSKFEGALMELEETAYWLEVIVEMEMISNRKLAPLQKETDELTAMLTAAVRKLKGRTKPAAVRAGKAKG